MYLVPLKHLIWKVRSFGILQSNFSHFVLLLDAIKRCLKYVQTQYAGKNWRTTNDSEDYLKYRRCQIQIYLLP